MKILKILNGDNRLLCPFCNDDTIELKTNFTMIKENCKDDAHTIYIDLYCKRCKGYHQLYITTYRGSTYVGWNKTVNYCDTFYTREDKTKEVVDR